RWPTYRVLSRPHSQPDVWCSLGSLPVSRLLSRRRYTEAASRLSLPAAYMSAFSPLPSSRPSGEVTHLLQAIEAGHARSEDLLPVVYQELRRLAAARMQAEAPGQTLQPTALAHDAWLRLAGADLQARWHSRGHSGAAAAEAMRRILVENARRKGRIKHGGEARRVELLDADAAFEPDDFAGLLALDEALAEFARV